MIELKGTNVLLIPVEADAYLYTRVNISEPFYFEYRRKGIDDWFEVEVGFDFKIIGVVEANYEADFDVEPFVECISANLDLWRNYNDVPPYMEYQCKSAQESFRSRMNASGAWMHNEFSEEKPDLLPGITESERKINKWVMVALKHWQQAEDRIVRKFVVIIKK